MKTVFAKALKGVEWIEDQLGGVLLLVAAVLVFVQIVLRACNLSLSGLYEIAAFCALWSVFLTAGVGIQRNIHVRVDVVLMICPPRLAHTLNLISSLLVCSICAVLLYSGYLLVEESLMFGDTTLGMISIPMWIPQLIMPIGGFLMLVHAVAHLVMTAQTISQHAQSTSVTAEVSTANF